jgi:hypothetical protein
MGGTNSRGVYGTMGVSAPDNIPPARFQPVSWTDSNGNFWLFGGQNQANLSFNDLWEYSPVTNMWTWMSGSISPGAAGVYGTKGAASVGSVPPSRSGAVGWTDNAGKLWLFGGGSNTPYSFYNDLWMFDPMTSLWTWVSGSNLPFAGGVYGVQGIASASNVPGSRNSPVNWVDSDGNLWLFGGGGYGSNGVGNLNDLWKFDTATRMWTWVGGSNLVNATGVYGTEGTAAAGNVPGAREWATSWVQSGSNLWLFGGHITPSFNDLWAFNTKTGLWTWVSGSDTGDTLGVYGTKGIASPANAPGARIQTLTWTDAKGNLWLFGGAVRYDLANPAEGRSSDDLWEFDIASREWTWMSGGNAGYEYPVYGTLGVPSTSNDPGGRSGAVSWTDSAGNLWLFGGSVFGSGYSDDLWRYTP